LCHNCQCAESGLASGAQGWILFFTYPPVSIGGESPIFGEKMQLKFSSLLATSSTLLLAFGLPSMVSAQTGHTADAMQAVLPEAPAPVLMAMATPVDTESVPQSGQVAPSNTAAQNSSQHEKAEQQMKEQEHQRVLGILPAFNTSYRSDAVSLTASQKMRLAFRSAVDPVTFAGALVVAGVHEAQDSNTGFGWGPEGYGKRAGAAYLDSFDGTMIGNGILPAVLHQDPRYFRLGQGTFRHRMLYALATTVVCKHDKTGKWEPNYSNIAGNIAAGGISNLYYPSSDSGIGQTFTNGLVVTAEGSIGSIFQEFWPDIARKLLHQDPTHGLDAQAAGKTGK